MSELIEGPVLRRDEDGVAVISFNRPDRHNALSDALIGIWWPLIAEVADDETVRCILLRGEGPSFSSGRDREDFGRRAAGESDHTFVRRAQEASLRLIDAPKPVVAAVQGHCIGGACEIALAADFRIAADDASFALPEVRFGLLPDTGASWLLPPLVGRSRAKRMIMTGEPVDAGTALDWGMVDRVVTRAELDAEALAFARGLAAGPPLALAFAKHLVDGSGGRSAAEALRDELGAQTALFASEDHQEAKRALSEGRAPRFRGR